MGKLRPIRVLLADDHALIRRGITSLLAEEPDFEIVGEASNGQEAVERAKEIMPDIILMEVYMPGMSGLEATRRIKQTLPSAKVVILTLSEDHEDVIEAGKSGAQGYLLKSIEPCLLAETLRGIMRGEHLFPKIPEGTSGTRPADEPEISPKELPP